MVGCTCRVGVATQAGSVHTRNGDTLNRTPLADMWLIHKDGNFIHGHGYPWISDPNG